MAQQLQQQQLRDVGSKLRTPPASKDALLELLKQAANYLSEIGQSQSPSILNSMKPCLNAIAKQELLKHQDSDVKVLVATCICEITRITAPEAPFSDDALRDIFHLIIGTFSGLRDINSPSFGRRVAILEAIARYRSSVVLLDLECDDLINEMFSTFFAVISDTHPKNVLTSMQKIMVLILDESEDIHETLLTTMLTPLGQKRSDFSPAARKLAMDIIEHCAGKLEPSLKQFLVSSLSGDDTCVNNPVDYHEVIYDVYQCAPHILSGIVPYITGELLADALDVRLKAVQLLGELFSSPGLSISESFQPLFSEFLKRSTDRAEEVRASVIKHLKNCLISNPSRPEASSIIKVLCDYLLDPNESVRKLAIAAIHEVACYSLEVMPTDTVRRVAEGLQDKSVSIKKYTMKKLADLYRVCCLKSTDNSAIDELEWIPGKILTCLYDKGFSSESIELILCGFLFPPEFSINDRLKHWAKIYSGFDKIEVKALEQVLAQKQRLQQEMQKYLSLRPTYKEDAPEFQIKVSACFRTMSRLFSEPTKAEEGFQIFNQLKDVHTLKMLTTLLDPCTSFNEARLCRDDLLKMLGEKHSLYEFVDMLSMKCSYLLFNKEYVKEILVEASAQKSAEDVKFIESCMSLLAIIVSFLPQLLAGFEENLINLLKEDTEIVKEGAAQVLAKAGGTIREQLATTSSSVDLLLERLCLEGSRKQAKYSVQALAAITKDDGLKSLSVLYKRLVDMLEEKTHLPTILQSLGCIAQIAMPVFETREEEIFEFIKHKVLEINNKTEGITTNEDDWTGRSELCLLKIFSIKTLVKSCLPIRDAHLRPGIEKIMEILRNILSFGDIAKDIESSAVDKAHMRLASAKAVLRLARQWDDKIPLDVFYMTLRVSEDYGGFRGFYDFSLRRIRKDSGSTDIVPVPPPKWMQDSFAQPRKLFISKIQQYIKEHLLDAKYACALLLNVNHFPSPEYEEGKHNLLEIIQICRQVRAPPLSMQKDENSAISYPKYILVYLVHALAHHPSCPSVDECKDANLFVPIFWRLHLFLSLLLHGDEDGQPRDSVNKGEYYAKVLSIFHSIKCSEDAFDITKSKISHAICDIGLIIAKRLVSDQADILGGAASLTLPPTLYKPAEKKEGENSVDNPEQLWLSGENVLAHFEALKFQDKEPSVPGSAAKDDTVLEEKDGDDSEVPLGKILKILKSQGAKKKKALKKNNSPSDLKDLENDVDILGVVRDINLDAMKSDQLSTEVGGLTIDNVFSESRWMSTVNSNEEASASQIKKETNGIADFIVLTPKRKRSVIMHRSPSEFTKGQSESKVLSYSRSNKMDKKKNVEPMVPDLVSHLPKIKSTSKKDDESKLGVIISDPKRSNNSRASIKKIGSSRSSTGSPKKRKISDISGLAKCSSHGTRLNNEELVGSRIKVWWPLDKVFYEGVVQSYDPGQRKHTILYDDGDEEVLNLNKEKWESITSTDMPRKQLKLQYPSSNKEMSQEKKNKKYSLSNSSQKRKSPKKVRRKLSLISRKASENDGADNAEGNGDSDLLDAHSPSGSDVDDDVNSAEKEEKDEVLPEAEQNNKAKPVPPSEKPSKE